MEQTPPQPSSSPTCTMQAVLSCSSALFYWILIGIVVWVYGIITFICLFIQWFHILILGKRHEGLSNFAKGYLEYLVHVMNYVYIINDKHPNILPVPVRVYEEEVHNP